MLHNLHALPSHAKYRTTDKWGVMGGPVFPYFSISERDVDKSGKLCSGRQAMAKG